MLNRGFSISIGVVASISPRRSAGSAARYLVTVDAGIGQVYHVGFCRCNCNVRGRRGSAHLKDTLRLFASQMSKCLDPTPRIPTRAQTAIRESRIASVRTGTNELFYPRIASSIAAEARPRGSAPPCSHSCGVRFEICRRSAAWLCEKSFFSRHARSRADSSSPADFRCRICRGYVLKLIWLESYT